MHCVLDVGLSQDLYIVATKFSFCAGHHVRVIHHRIDLDGPACVGSGPHSCEE